MTTTTLMPLSRMLDSFFAPSACRVDADAPLQRVPRAEILEGEKDYVIRMDLPGVDREHLEIELEDETLSVKAVRDAELPEGYRALRSEFANGKISYQRSFSLGRTIEVEQVSAKLENGTLTLTLPKSQQAVARRIQVK